MAEPRTRSERAWEATLGELVATVLRTHQATPLDPNRLTVSQPDDTVFNVVVCEVATGKIHGVAVKFARPPKHAGCHIVDRLLPLLEK